MDLSILIVNWNTKDLLEESVSSIFRYTKDISFEVIVFDNGSTDGSVEMIEEKYPDVILIKSPENKGFVVGNLEAYKKSTGRYVLMLNSDAYLVSDELKKVIDYMDAHEDVGIVGPRLEYADGSLQKSVRAFPEIWSQAFILLKAHNLFQNFGPIRKYYMNYFDYSKTAKVDQVMGAALFTRKGIIEEIGFLDDTFWAWFEEVDYCKRVQDAGYTNMYLAEARVRHHKGQSFKNLAKRQKLFNTSMTYYFSKHHPAWTVWLIRILKPLSMLLSYSIQLIGKLVPLKKNRDL